MRGVPCHLTGWGAGEAVAMGVARGAMGWGFPGLHPAVPRGGASHCRLARRQKSFCSHRAAAVKTRLIMPHHSVSASPRLHRSPHRSRTFLHGCCTTGYLLLPHSPSPGSRSLCTCTTTCRAATHRPRSSSAPTTPSYSQVGGPRTREPGRWATPPHASCIARPIISPSRLVLRSA